MSEKRLIDAERLKRILVRFEQHLLEFGKKEAAEAVRCIVKRLKLEPTVDAVEVVRCKDCKHWEQNPHQPCYGQCIRVDYDPPVTSQTDFCSLGESK